MSWSAPVRLEGAHVCLTPVAERDVAELWAIGQHESLWRYMPFAVRSEGDMRALVANHLQDQARGLTQAFVTRLAASGEAVGSTAYLAMSRPNRRLEIGATWVSPAYQRSVVNTEAKLLQLTHAFEVLDCNRVEFKTDSLNERSRAALARIGATEEGTFRAHMIMPDGRLRHSVYFSVVRDEWPAVRARLTARLAAT